MPKTPQSFRVVGITTGMDGTLIDRKIGEYHTEKAAVGAAFRFKQLGFESVTIMTFV